MAGFQKIIQWRLNRLNIITGSYFSLYLKSTIIRINHEILISDQFRIICKSQLLLARSAFSSLELILSFLRIYCSEVWIFLYLRISISLYESRDTLSGFHLVSGSGKHQSHKPPRWAEHNQHSQKADHLQRGFILKIRPRSESR